MNVNPRAPSHARRHLRAGFTLMEVSTAMSLMVVLSIAMVVMIQQHVTFMSLAQKQTFLSDDAPKIGNLVARIFNQADHYFVYPDLDSAMGGATPVLSGGGAVRLFFKTAAQETEQRVLAAEEGTQGTELKFYTLKADGTQSSWTVASRLQGATFSAEQGVLSVTLQGPNGEEISYCGGGR